MSEQRYPVLRSKADTKSETYQANREGNLSALEALGVHPYDAERRVRGFLLNDREQMFALASSFDPSVPVHENEEYVRRTREFLDRDAEVMKGNSEAFGSRLDRGWVPPTLDDLEAETRKGSTDEPPDTG